MNLRIEIGHLHYWHIPAYALGQLKRKAILTEFGRYNIHITYSRVRLDLLLAQPTSSLDVTKATPRPCVHILPALPQITQLLELDQ